MDAENMKFPSGTLFDVIWAIESISHFPHKEEFFRDAVALLKPGGKFILADWFQSEGIKHEEREKIINQHGNKCDNCFLSRNEARKNFGRDLSITKLGEVLCRKCFLSYAMIKMRSVKLKQP